MSIIRFAGIHDLHKNISWLPTVHIHKAGLKNLHNSISIYLSHHPHLPFSNQLSLPHLFKNANLSHHTCPIPQNLFNQNDLQKWSPKWYLPSFLFCLSHIWPSIQVLLNNCFGEVLLLGRLYNVLSVLGQHPVSLLLISHCVFTHSFLSESYPSYFNAIPQTQDWSPSPVALCLDSHVNPNLYLDISVGPGGWANAGQRSQGCGENVKASVTWPLCLLPNPTLCWLWHQLWMTMPSFQLLKSNFFEKSYLF